MVDVLSSSISCKTKKPVYKQNRIDDIVNYIIIKLNNNEAKERKILPDKMSLMSIHV